jgi:hypothetical protein
MRTKLTIVHRGVVQTFNQLAEGESLDEFRGRALHMAGMPEGAEYYHFEREGHMYSGDVPESCLGHKRVHHQYGPDEMLPGLFLRRGSEVRDYKAAL